MYKMILAGYGGQGMLLSGQVLSLAAINDGYKVTWFPSYGPEMRGGAAACSVVVSEKPIGSPVVKSADLVAAVSQPAFDKYHAAVVSGGTILYNSNIIVVSDKRDDIRYTGIDFSRLTMDIGNSKVYNMLVLGSIKELLGCVTVPSLTAALKEKFGEKKKDLLELNEKAILMGIEAVKRLA